MLLMLGTASAYDRESVECPRYPVGIWDSLPVISSRAHTYPCTSPNKQPAMFICNFQATDAYMRCPTIAHTHTHTQRERDREREKKREKHQSPRCLSSQIIWMSSSAVDAMTGGVWSVPEAQLGSRTLSLSFPRVKD